MPDPIDDEALMHQYREGDLLAFQELYRRYKAEIYRYVAWRSPRPEWVDEIVQDTWATMHRVRNRYLPDASVRVHLYLVARNRLYESLRQHQHLLPSGVNPVQQGRDMFDVLADAMQEPPDTSGFYASMTDKHAWQGKLARLPGEMKETVVLQQFNGLELIEIAPIVSLAVGKVRERLRNAVFILRPMVFPDRYQRKQPAPGEPEINDVDDAQLDAFLSGSDALSKHLAQLVHPESTAQTEQPIIKRVTFALEQDAYLPMPNDVAEAAVAPAASEDWLQYWPVAAALALVVVIFVAVKLFSQPEATPEMTYGVAGQGAGGANTSTRESDMVAHSNAPQAEQNTNEAPQEKSHIVTAQGAETEAAPISAASSPGSTANADAWLGVINDLLKNGLKYEAVEEYRKFRSANPDYPVPAATLAQIKAAQK
jgi:RNA polymerase sigma factor (sigma-70 family)